MSCAGSAESVRAKAVVNCAGLFAQEVAALAGAAPFAIYPRKGEFLVFEPPAGGPLQVGGEAAARVESRHPAGVYSASKDRNSGISRARKRRFSSAVSP